MSANHSNIEVKNNATRDQLENILDILGKGFSVGRAFFQERIDHDPTFNPENTWYATVDEVIASSIQIFPMPLRVGQDILKVGGIGSVCTHENYQGMGLATRILTEQTKWMKEQGYHLSMLLASKHSFYNRSGWLLLPECIYKLDNPQYQSTVDASKQQTSTEQQYNVAAFAPEHLAEMNQLYHAFNKNRTGSYVRDEIYWSSLVQWPTWREAECLLLWKQNKLVAYGIIAHTRDEQAILREFIYDPQAEEVDVMPLFTALCQLRADAKYILAKLPYDHRLMVVFQEKQATAQQLDIAMWKIINYKALFNDLQAQLQERWLSKGQLLEDSLQLKLKTEHAEVVFSLEPSKLQISVNDSNATIPQAGIKVTELTLIKWLLYGFDAADEKEITEEANAAAETETLLAALFPPQPYAFYITDYY